MNQVQRATLERLAAQLAICEETTMSEPGLYHRAFGGLEACAARVLEVFEITPNG